MAGELRREVSIGHNSGIMEVKKNTGDKVAQEQRHCDRTSSQK